MRELFISIAFTFLAGTCFAGNVEIAVPVISPVTAPASVGVGPAWEGFYIGASSAYENGDQSYLSGGAFSNGPWEIHGSTFGAFAGYNFQAGPMIYGAEAAYLIGDVGSAIPSEFGANYARFLDIKARAGYALGDAMLYGVVGQSLGVWEDRVGPPETTITSGLNYGLGVDYQITERFFLGAEYLVRDLSADFDAPSDVGVVTQSQSAQIRVGLRF